MVKIIENWPAKVLSVALALILFVFHQMNITATRSLSVPLNVETSPALVPASDFPQSVRVQLRGEDDSIRSIADNEVEAFVDFSRHEVGGLYRAPVQVRRRGSAQDIEPLEVSVTPIEIFVQLDQRGSRTLPLVADIRGNAAAGFDLVSHSISPAEIVVAGPLGLLENVTEIRTDPIDIGGRSADFNLMVSIINPNPFFIMQGSGTAEFSGLVRPSAIP